MWFSWSPWVNSVADTGTIESCEMAMRVGSSTSSFTGTGVCDPVSCPPFIHWEKSGIVHFLTSFIIACFSGFNICLVLMSTVDSLCKKKHKTTTVTIWQTWVKSLSANWERSSRTRKSSDVFGSNLYSVLIRRFNLKNAICRILKTNDVAMNKTFWMGILCNYPSVEKPIDSYQQWSRLDRIKYSLPLGLRTHSFQFIVSVFLCQ